MMRSGAKTVEARPRYRRGHFVLIDPKVFYSSLLAKRYDLTYDYTYYMLINVVHNQDDKLSSNLYLQNDSILHAAEETSM